MSSSDRTTRDPAEDGAVLLSGAPKDFVLDDEPLECILYDAPGSGPTTVGLFGLWSTEVAEIQEAFERGETEGWLRGIRRLLQKGVPLPAKALFDFLRMVQTQFPVAPWPEHPQTDVPCSEIVEPVLSIGLARNDPELIERAGTILYRYFEGCDRFNDAVHVLKNLLDQAERKGDRAEIAMCWNNIGYEYLLDHRWARGEPFFARAAEVFEAVGRKVDCANARANLLLCRYETARGRIPEGFEAELCRLLATLGGDWRRRKPLLLLARVAERKGDLETAIDLARQAADSSVGIPTRHRKEDLGYVARLEKRLGSQPPA